MTETELSVIKAGRRKKVKPRGGHSIGGPL